MEVGRGIDLTGGFCSRWNERESTGGGSQVRPIKKYKPEQIVTILRQMEVQMANGKTAPQACQEAEIHTQTYYRWRKEFGGLKLEQAKRENEILAKKMAELEGQAVSTSAPVSR